MNRKTVGRWILHDRVLTIHAPERYIQAALLYLRPFLNAAARLMPDAATVTVTKTLHRDSAERVSGVTELHSGSALRSVLLARAWPSIVAAAQLDMDVVALCAAGQVATALDCVRHQLLPKTRQVAARLEEAGHALTFRFADGQTRLVSLGLETLAAHLDWPFVTPVAQMQDSAGRLTRAHSPGSAAP